MGWGGAVKNYASFFEWPDRSRKELGVVEELVVALNNSAGLTLCEPKVFEKDPPDCVCLNDTGGVVAIEVAEVVCEDATRLNAQGSCVYRRWRPGELATHISRTLAGKDAKIFHGGPYSSIIACLFTDEPALTVEQAKSELCELEFGPYSQITKAFLLFSYSPATRSYPVIPLRIRQ